MLSIDVLSNLTKISFKNTHASGFDELLENISSRLLVVEAFPLKNLSRCLRSGSQLVSGQVNMEYEATLCSSICSNFEMLVVQDAVGHCGRELGPFLLTNVGCRHFSFWCISSIC